MNKDYAEYRLKHHVNRHPGLSLEAYSGDVLTGAWHEVNGKLQQQQDYWSFTLRYDPTGVGCRFAIHSENFMLDGLTKEGLDAIFLSNYIKVITSAHDTIVLNIREGNEIH